MESLARLVVIMCISLAALIAACMMWFVAEQKPGLKWHWLWIAPACIATAFGMSLVVINLLAQL